MLYLTLLGKTMCKKKRQGEVHCTQRHKVTKSQSLPRDTLAMLAMTMVVPFHRRRCSAAPRDHYDPSTCARIAVPNGHRHWPSKDAFWAQI